VHIRVEYVKKPFFSLRRAISTLEEAQQRFKEATKQKPPGGEPGG
jgi:hypothetical protein